MPRGIVIEDNMPLPIICGGGKYAVFRHNKKYSKYHIPINKKAHKLVFVSVFLATLIDGKECNDVFFSIESSKYAIIEKLIKKALSNNK